MENTQTTITKAPKLGAMVYFTNDNEEQEAAIITKVYDGGKVGLKAFSPSDLKDYNEIPLSETYKKGHWTWPQ